MPNALVQHSPQTEDRVTELKSQIMAVQEQLEKIVRGAGGLRVILPELHDETTGRINAQKLAVYMGVPLKRLADGLQLNYKAVHRNPSAETFQSALKPAKRSLEILHEFFNKPATVRVWLNTPHPDLEGSTALEMILANNSNAVLRILENAVAGVPV
jgi:hypothetical protein